MVMAVTWSLEFARQTGRVNVVQDLVDRTAPVRRMIIFILMQEYVQDMAFVVKENVIVIRCICGVVLNVRKNYVQMNAHHMVSAR